MNKLNVGDRVIYVSNEHGISKANPLWGSWVGYVKGTLIDVSDDKYLRLRLTVKWDNGYMNSYDWSDLKYTTDLPESLFEL